MAQKRKVSQAKPKVRHARDHALSPDAVKRLLRSAKSPRDRLYLRLLCNWGLRADEVAHLCINWVDSQRGWIAIPKQCGCYRCRLTGKPWRAKNENAARKIPIAKHTETYEALKIFFERFSDPEKQQVSRQRVWQIVKKLAGKAGIFEIVYPHALRATAATQLADMGANEIALCRVMGWADLRSAWPYIKTSVAPVENFLEGKDLKWWG